jgi:acetoin utilization deacetylase AcuC-like enzyme
MAKFGQLYGNLIQTFRADQIAVHQPELPKMEWIELVHEPNFVQDYYFGTLDPQAQRRIGLPWSDALVTRTLTAVGGTILTARLALDHGLALNTAGGTHHAFPAFGSGFCIFNDLAIAARLLQQEHKINTALILDLDVHQGDGTAFIFSHDSSVITCSIHCEKNFPSHKQTSDIDISLPEGTTDTDYLNQLDRLLETLFDQHQPDLVLYNAGVDPHQDDLLGKMNLSTDGILRRDQKVLKASQTAKIPIACVIGGGYGKDMQGLIQRHMLLFQAAHQIYLDPS